MAAAFSLAAIVVVPMTSLLAGGLAFGWRALTVVDLEHTTVFAVAGTTLSPAAVAGRLGLATGVVALSLVSTFAATLLLSTLTRSPFSAAAGGSGSA